MEKEIKEFTDKDFEKFEKQGFVSWDGNLKYAWNEPSNTYMWNPKTKVFYFQDSYKGGITRKEKLLIGDIRKAAVGEGQEFLKAIGDGDKTMQQFFKENSWHIVLSELILYRESSILSLFATD